MWIISKSGCVIVNSNQAKSFGLIGAALYVDGNIILGDFQTNDEAKKELKQIYDALIAGQESYSVG